MIASKPAYERRKDPRLSNSIPVKICKDDGDSVTETANISRSGAYCKVSSYVEPMTKLDIHLLIPSKKNDKVSTKKVSCGGVVVRTEPNTEDDTFNIAIFFNDISLKDAEIISEYVQYHVNPEEE